jgi:hypothetical protein
MGKARPAGISRKEAPTGQTHGGYPMRTSVHSRPGVAVRWIVRQSMIVAGCSLIIIGLVERV